MKFKKLQILVGCAILSTQPLVAQAQSVLSDEHDANITARTLLERVIQRACPADQILPTINAVAIGKTADWLTAQNRDKEAKRLRSIQQKVIQRQAEQKEEMPSLIAKLERQAQSKDWNPDELLPIAMAQLGGEDALVEYTTAARKAAQNAFAAPSPVLLDTPEIKRSAIFSTSPGPGLRPVPTGAQSTFLASIELPLDFYDYFRTGKAPPRLLKHSFSNPPLYVNSALIDAESAARKTAADTIATDSSIPLNKSLAHILTDLINADRQPDAEHERALIYAATLGRTCITAYVATYPMSANMALIETVFIPELKKEGAW